MAEVVPRIMDMAQNLVTASASAQVASSEETAFPVGALLDQLRSDILRFKLGWTIGAENNKIDFNRGGVLVATVASGTYATAADLATAVVAALEAADSTPVWACSYNGSTHVFTISSDLTFSLLNSTGANRANNCTYDMGYVAVDVSGTTTYTGGVSYQSRHFVHVDFGSTQTFTACLLTNHNSGAGGTYSFQASSSTLIGVGLGSTAPTVNETLDGTGAIRYKYISSASHRYARIVVDNIANSDGYNEIGVWYVGPYISPRAFLPEAKDGTEPLDDLATAANGAHYRITRQTRDHWFLNWSFISDADKVVLMSFIDRAGVGGNFFFAFDTSGAPSNIRYCFFPTPPPDFDSIGSGTVWRWMGVHIAEALG
jgi:hypothetical protein